MNINLLIQIKDFPFFRQQEHCLPFSGYKDKDLNLKLVKYAMAPSFFKFSCLWYFCNFLKFTKYYNEIRQKKVAKLDFSSPHVNIRRKVAIINYIVVSMS